jgi:hypothetical protein
VGQQELLASLSEAVVGALASKDVAAMRDAHIAIYTALLREGRAACAALGIPYPISDAGERDLLEFYRREWPASLPGAP